MNTLIQESPITQLERPLIQYEQPPTFDENFKSTLPWAREIVGVMTDPEVKPYGAEGWRMVYFATQGEDGQLRGHREIIGPGETLVLRERGEGDDRRIWAVGEEMTESLFSAPSAGEQFDWGNGGWRRPYQGVRVIDPNRANAEAYAVKDEGDALREAELTKAKVREARTAVQLAEESLRLASLMVGPLLRRAQDAGLQLHDDVSERRPFHEYGYLERLRVASDLINIMMRSRAELPAAHQAFEDAVVAHRREIGVVGLPVVEEDPLTLIEADLVAAARSAEAPELTAAEMDEAAAVAPDLKGSDVFTADADHDGGVVVVNALTTTADKPERRDGDGDGDEFDTDRDTDAGEDKRESVDENVDDEEDSDGRADKDEHDENAADTDGVETDEAPRPRRTVLVLGDMPQDVRDALTRELS
ncbi:MAG TPA: hypothetical protein VL737_00780 [Candidatus Pristimantibacillus sp.]|nr:hypothetical protein [Candidatus Pristimantibacillus sp.]